MLSEKAQLNAMDMTAAATARAISRRLGIEPDEAMARFLQSKTAELLYDPSLKYWCDGPACIVNEYISEIGA